ncbi:MAG: TonB-dependent receptor plug domain-containing protein, partial [Lewinella sp.]|nr:TonB-dependent receptor plug domain-containing protein [Lewinella sp.]
MLTKNFKTFLCCAVALLLSAGAAMAQQRVSGVIKDDAGEPLIGVNILVQGTGLGTVTDADGAFQLEVPGPESVLQISYTGYVAQDITVGTQSVIDVTMGEDVVGLEEVVVVGYGTVKKKDLTGAVSQIDAEKLETEATANITDLLRANVPGLNVGFNTSAKGISSAENLEVRGSTNVRGAAANAPLIVVDGMIYSGDLADINPNDIATFDILKDASSAAIYGSRA